MHSDFTPDRVTMELKPWTTSYDGSSDEEVQRFAKLVSEGKRYIIFNVWIPLETVKDYALALCSPNSVKPEEKSQGTDFNSVAKIVFWKYNKNHKWFYLSSQTPKEALVFISYDSKSGQNLYSVPHASFKDPRQKNKDGIRKSFETRVIAVFEEGNEDLLPPQPAQ